MFIKFLITSIFAMSFGHANQDVSVDKRIFNSAEVDLPHSGILENADGFIHVSISDDYIHHLVSYIKEEGFEEPPYFEVGKNAGAHISVIFPNETERYGLEKIEEIGKRFFFNIKECKAVHPPNWKGVESVYIITIDAPDLDALREKHGLPKAAHAFHITIGIKYQLEKSA